MGDKGDNWMEGLELICGMVVSAKGAGIFLGGGKFWKNQRPPN